MRMRNIVAPLFAPLLLVPALPPSGTGAPSSPAIVADTVPITEWVVPWEGSRPRDPYVAPDGRVWFVGQEGNYVAVLDPRSGKFERFAITDGTNPHNLIVDRRGIVWYAGNRNARIGRLDPASGAVREYPMPDAAVRDPHTLVFGRDGEIWFTAQGANAVGRFDPATGEIRTTRVGRGGSRPYGIVVDRAGTPWVALFGTNRIASIDPASMTLREFTLPNERSRARRLVAGPDQAIWYVDYTRGYLGRLDPRTGAVREWAAPGGAGALPYAMEIDDGGRLWFVETGPQPNRLVGFDPARERFFSVTPFGGTPNTVRHMVFHAPTRTLWFGTDANTIARARVP
jgi:virginiamycin B lyase